MLYITKTSSVFWPDKQTFMESLICAVGDRLSLIKVKQWSGHVYTLSWTDVVYTLPLFMFISLLQQAIVRNYFKHKNRKKNSK